MADPVLSVIIPTMNRAGLLGACLESLIDQTMPKDQYEIIVVDDGSTDGTREVCQAFSSRMSLKCVSIDHAGIAAAKNAGIRQAAGSIVLFADDDDLAGPELLREHETSHQQNPAQDIAVLGHISWAPGLELTPVMQCIGDFGYEDMQDGQIFNFEFYWGGLCSCKRAFLVENGVFNEGFTSIIEDIELAYRVGLRVLFNRHAASYMVRPITHAVFCDRCERQGRALFLFNRLHPHDAAVLDYCQRNILDPIAQQNLDISEAEGKWEAYRTVLESDVRRVNEIEKAVLGPVDASQREKLSATLRDLYSSTFNGFKLKGFVEAMRAT